MVREGISNTDRVSQKLTAERASRAKSCRRAPGRGISRSWTQTTLGTFEEQKVWLGCSAWGRTFLVALERKREPAYCKQLGFYSDCNGKPSKGLGRAVADLLYCFKGSPLVAACKVDGRVRHEGS